MPKRLYLIDGSGFIFRAYYGLPPLSTRSGVPTQAVIGFAKMLGKLLKEDKPDFLIVAFDTGQPTFRHQLYEPYKVNRQAPPEDLLPQFGLIEKLVNAMQIPSYKVIGFEADDILATLSKQAIQEGYKVTLVTGDKDLMQLVDENVQLFDPLKNFVYDVTEVTKRYGVSPQHLLDVLALAGDSSDNVPGVPKIGIKTAAKLVQEHGDLEAVLAYAKTVKKPKASEISLVENEALARLSKKLITLHTEVPLICSFEHYQGPNREALAKLLEELEAFRLLENLFPERTPQNPKPFLEIAPPKKQPIAQPKQTIDRSQYRTIQTKEELLALEKSILEHRRFAIDCETTSLDTMQAKIVGIAIAVPEEAAVYIPIAHCLAPLDLLNHNTASQKPLLQLDLQTVQSILKPLLEDPRIAKVGQNLKYDWQVLRQAAGITMQGITDDSMLAAYVLDSSRMSYGLDSLAFDYLQHETIHFKDLLKKHHIKDQQFAKIPIEDATTYAAEDADIALRLTTSLRARIQQEESLTLALYETIEMPLLEVLAHMEYHGILLHQQHLQTLDKEFQKRLQTLEDQTYQWIGRPINLSSPKQLAELFFEELKWPAVKKTKTGYSTDQSVLEELAKEQPLAQLVLEHRMLLKLKSTYVDALQKMVNPQTGRIHTSYHQTGTATGRLSSSDPNLQNIPIRSPDGKRIREAFIAPKGYTLISLDYSQIELRILAHLSEDAAFIQAFQDGDDIHQRTAQEIFHQQEVDSEMRRRAKAINFGILYGLSEYGLSKQLGINRQEAKDIIYRYFSRYPSIQDYFEKTIHHAEKTGFSSTLLGRKRYLPHINSQNKTLREATQRMAKNSTIQGSAADLIKKAMHRSHVILQEKKLDAHLLLQVHDELVLECPLSQKEHVSHLIQKAMTEALDLRVPLVVDVGFGCNWTEAHP